MTASQDLIFILYVLIFRRDLTGELAAIGAMIIQGIQPGLSVMTEQPALFWGLIVSMWIGNLMLLVLNLPLVGFG